MTTPRLLVNDFERLDLALGRLVRMHSIIDSSACSAIEIIDRALVQARRQQETQVIPARFEKRMTLLRQLILAERPELKGDVNHIFGTISRVTSLRDDLVHGHLMVLTGQPTRVRITPMKGRKLDHDKTYEKLLTELEEDAILAVAGFAGHITRFREESRRSILTKAGLR